jgi:hypothetical protein
VERHRSVGELAARQHGVAAVWQLRELGVSDDAIARRVGSAQYVPLHRGVVAIGHARLRVEGRWMAAVLACGPDTRLSYSDGLMLWGVHRTSARRIHVVVPRRTGGAKQPRGIVIHRCKLDPRDATVVDGIPVTTLARALLDFAEIARGDQLERALDEAERRGLLDLDDVLDVLERTRGRRGRRVLRRAIDLYVPEPHHVNSWLERHALPLVRRAGGPMPEVNLGVNGHVVDLHWPAQKLIVELDSRTHHATTRAFEQDRRRDADHVANGYRVMRFTHRRITREPEAVLALLRQALSAAAAAR